MMNYIWAALIIFSIIFSCLFGDVTKLSNVLLTSGNDALELALTLAGGMCLWGGLMRIADKSGITKLTAKLFSPLIGLIMPGVKRGSNAERAVTMNMAANLLGLGNAATPLGLKAMEELDKLNGHSPTASPAMTAFVVLNTASIQLLPSTIAMLRVEYGSANAMSILPCVWIVSVITVTIGLVSCKIFTKSAKKEG
ncbi:MAG: spore maturation protein A [Oscillospiraceae bacterium]|nr:spore maturation protein A [Oscillospiraceae bacterium]